MEKNQIFLTHTLKNEKLINVKKIIAGDLFQAAVNAGPDDAGNAVVLAYNLIPLVVEIDGHSIDLDDVKGMEVDEFGEIMDLLNVQLQNLNLK